MKVEIEAKKPSLDIKKKKTSINLKGSYTKSSALIDKKITEDGEYYAYNDNADGYSSINVNVLGTNDFLAKFTTDTLIDIKMLGDVPEGAFSNVSILNSVDLTLSKKISSYAFNNSKNLTNIIAPNPLEIDNGAFYYCTKASGEITISKEQTEIYNNTFNNCSKLNVILHDNIKQIGENAFENCELLETSKLPRELMTLGTYCFRNTGITINEIPEGIEQIPSYCFFYCKSIKTLKINNNVTKIDKYSFGSCTSLTLLEIGTGIKQINQYAFANCTSLTTVVIHAKQPPTLQRSNIFNNDENLIEIKVPVSQLETYKSASNWSNYADIMIGIEEE